MAQAEAAGPSEPAPSGWGQRRRMSVEEVADDEADELPLLAERRQEPLAAAMELLLTSKGVKALGKAIKKGASLNSPFTDSHGFDRLVGGRKGRPSSLIFALTPLLWHCIRSAWSPVKLHGARKGFCGSKGGVELTRGHGGSSGIALRH
eukprot:m.107100 g.107100  ORF g.107100 m.107100 type:complete len:149 (+) comp21136_c0_seq1:246-692(+)